MVDSGEALFISANLPWKDTLRDQLGYWIERLSLSLVIIDPLVMWELGVKKNAADEMTRLMYGLRRIVQKTGCTILVVHHNRKGGGDYGEGIRGSSAIYGAVDFALELKKTEELLK